VRKSKKEIKAARKAANSRRFYRLHREELLQKEHERYMNDPEYREALRQRARKRYERFGKTRTGNTTRLWDVPRLMRLLVDGTDYLIYMYTTGNLAKCLGRSYAYVWGVEKSGVIPESTWYCRRGSRTVRLYTEDQVEAIARVYNLCFPDETKTNKWKGSRFRVLLLREYKKLKSGVDMEKYLSMGNGGRFEDGVVPDRLTLLIEE